jgi:hypothetical protein
MNTKTNMEKYTSLDTRLYILVMSVVGFIVTVSIIAENNMQLQRVPITYPTHVQNKAMTTRLCARHRNVLYGIFSTVGRVHHRNVARHQTQCNMNSKIHSTVFVLGSPRTEREYDILNMESKLYGDIFILTCVENMNEGKTYTYFKEALEQFPCFDFYAKVDDDTAFSPEKLSIRIRTMSNDMTLHIGRLYRSDATWKLLLKWIYYGFRDFSCTQRLQNYTSGMLYILNAQAVKQWIVLNPTQLYGDEDMRTTYFMKLIGAQVINVDTVFHDHISSKSEWKLEITNASLAVYRCKTAQMLSDSFASICT